MKNNEINLIIMLFSLILFFLVLSVIYLIISISENLDQSYLKIYIPFVVFSGFFIFLVAANLLSLVIFRIITK